MFELGTVADMTAEEVEEDALNPSEVDPDPKDDENSELEPAGICEAENKPLDGAAETVESENKFEEVVGAADTPDWVDGLEKGFWGDVTTGGVLENGLDEVGGFMNRLDVGAPDDCLIVNAVLIL